MKAKRKASKRKRKPTFGEEILKALHEVLDELKRQRLAPPSPFQIAPPAIDWQKWRFNPGPSSIAAAGGINPNSVVKVSLASNFSPLPTSH